MGGAGLLARIGCALVVMGVTCGVGAPAEHGSMHRVSVVGVRFRNLIGWQPAGSAARGRGSTVGDGFRGQTDSREEYGLTLSFMGWVPVEARI